VRILLRHILCTLMKLRRLKDSRKPVRSGPACLVTTLERRVSIVQPYKNISLRKILGVSIGKSYSQVYVDIKIR